MADYEFYVNQYKGSTIPEAAFPGMAARAQDHLDRMARIYRVEPAVENGEDLAVCAMAETLYAFGKQSAGVSAASVGSVSVRYESADDQGQAQEKALYRCALRYLDIYRGVKPC